MRSRPPPRRFRLLAAAIGGACAVAAAPTRADEPAPAAAPTVPVSATSQCVEGPGAPPADPTKVTRVPASAAAGSAKASPAAPPDDGDLDAPDVPGRPSRVLLELSAFAGVSARFDDAPLAETTNRAGLVLGGSVYVWPSRRLAFGAAYAHADLSRSEVPLASADILRVDYSAHTLFAEARVVPFRIGPAALFAAVGAGLAWQTAALHATFVSVDGVPGGSFRCEAGSNVEFAFRAGVGVKARVSRAAALFLDAAFFGYRLTSDVLDNCAPGAGTAQTLMARGGLTYDLDISSIVR